MRDVPWLGEEPPPEVMPTTDPWGLDEPLVPAPIAAALSAATFAILALVAVIVA
ncbi:hypothetical protein ACE7GA_12150 [Roseomonas sp. CCTCC AB2023176]|uniref:hypothetical protein n=1 Tax=Roseomonas sp. CCTCC AB2023176 TaxID=3342640 RepID=UPI0035E340F0